jgi:predicted HTH transcriptional regulator
VSTYITSGLTEEALILRLQSTEHDFVERKSRSDQGGWLQSAVAFANSTPVGWPAVLFVGVDDDGKPQLAPEKLEDLEKSVSDVLEQAYPAIYRHVIPLQWADGLSCCYRAGQ